jgi:sec-independent protein translocase protein TatA
VSNASKSPWHITWRNYLATSGNGLMLKAAMSLLASFMNLAGPDLVIILLIILVLFGAKKLPELARGMGQAVKEFQKAKDEFSDELNKAGKSEAETTKADVKPAQSTIPRVEDQPASSEMRPDPNQAITPGDKANQV